MAKEVATIYNIYDKKKQNHDAKIQVLRAARTFMIVWPKDERGYRGPTTRVRCDNFPDVAAT